MFTDGIEQPGKAKKHRKNAVAEIANALDSLITTFITALLLVVFVVQPFIIPTGSMATTLKGAHYRLRCTQCGYKYDYTYDSIPGFVTPDAVPPNSRCPNCGNTEGAGYPMPVCNGDRIIVLKCIYQFLEPKRWDVIVFRNPTDPGQNYIKRLIGLPEETVEIIDGDIYINGQIATKPAKVQERLWVPLYNSDFVPVDPNKGRFNGRKWEQPFDNSEDPAWQTGTKFRLSSIPNEIHKLPYNSKRSNGFRAFYSYNKMNRHGGQPFCSDLMIRFYATREGEGLVGAELSKYGINYKVTVDHEGRATVQRVDGEDERVLGIKQFRKPPTGEPILFEFANVDHRLILKFGDEKTILDLSAEDVGAIKRFIEPRIKLAGSGDLTLSHIALFRDIHYTSGNGSVSGTATEGNPFSLGKDEFFVLGDNSPASADGRWWDTKGLGNSGHLYTRGVVPRDYLVGKALFVFWPAGYKPIKNSPIALVPNFGQMRIIYGGTNEQ